MLPSIYRDWRLEFLPAGGYRQPIAPKNNGDWRLRRRRIRAACPHCFRAFYFFSLSFSFGGGSLLGGGGGSLRRGGGGVSLRRSVFGGGLSERRSVFGGGLSGRRSVFGGGLSGRRSVLGGIGVRSFFSASVRGCGILSPVFGVTRSLRSGIVSLRGSVLAPGSVRDGSPGTRPPG
jgi:hypothetical protein